MSTNNPDIHFYNWWPINNFRNEWFYAFAKSRKIEKPLAFFSVFGSRDFIRGYAAANKKTNKIIFFTGENVHNNAYGDFLEYQDYCLDDVDLSLGFDERNAENYFRFPLWIRYLYRCDWSYQDLKNYIEQINDPQFRLNANRNRFACHISRFDSIGIRKYLLDLLNPIEQIHSAGAFANNTNELKEKYNDNKIEYLKNFKFNLCPENSSVNSYVTEKIFQSIMGGCIPIYWGGGNTLIEPEVLNHKAFLHLNNDGSNAEQLVQAVSLLHSSPEIYQEFIHRKPFTENAADYIWEKLQKLEWHLTQE